MKEQKKNFQMYTQATKRKDSMKIKISFKHLDHTTTLDQKITEKSQKLKKYFEGNIDVHWICSVKEGKHHADVHVFGNHFEYFASSHEDTLYKCLDQAISKIGKQVVKKKTKWKDKIHHNGDHLKNIIQASAPETSVEDAA